MDKLKILDASFLYAETPSTPMHVAGLQHFEVPESAEDTFFDDLRAYMAERVHLLPFMTRKLMATPFGIDHPVWVNDDQFDIDHHVQRVRLPSPGSQRQLERVVARLHETPLDRNRPLWQFFLIEGLESGHVAWYTKYHHAVIDGMAGQAVVETIMSETPEAAPVPPREEQGASSPPGLLSLFWDAARNASTQPLRNARLLPGLAKAAWSLTSRALDRDRGLGALGQRAPKTRFNVAVGPYRSFAIGSLPLSTVKAVGKAHGCKVNDVFMSISAGAIRRYLAEREELPERPLIAGAPVSLREPGDRSMSNQVTMLLTSLETHLADPVQRMIAIRESAQRGKDVVADLKTANLEDLAIPGLPMAFSSMMAMTDRLRLGDLMPMPMNVLISNVAGPRGERWMCGAKLLTHYPVSIPSHGGALNITIQSYCDRMDFAITGCLDTVPDADVLRDYMLEEWEALQRRVNDGELLGPVPMIDPVTPEAPADVQETAEAAEREVRAA